VGTNSAADLVVCTDQNADGSCPSGMNLQCSNGSCQCCCPSSPPKPPDCNGEWICGGACGQSCNCGPAIVCGDGMCSLSENCVNCPQDCGACPPACGDGTCNGNETCVTCPQDCGPCTMGGGGGDPCGGECGGCENCDASQYPPQCVYQCTEFQTCDPNTKSCVGGGGGGGGGCSGDCLNCVDGTCYDLFF
jgi:hypothetical protein